MTASSASDRRLLTPGETVLLCGNRSGERVSGLTVAFDMLVSGYERNDVPHVIVDKGAIGTATQVGALDLGRAVKTLSVVFRFWAALPKVTTVYNTLAPTRWGFLRDACMIWPSRLLRRRVVLHLFGGGYGAFYAQQPRWLQRCIRSTLSNAAAIVVEGQLLREQFSFIEDVDEKVHVVPNGLPTGLDPRGVQPKSVPASDRNEPVRLLYMSNMIASKGYLDVLEACRHLRDSWDRPFQCDFCGAFMQTASDERIVTAAEARSHFEHFLDEHDLRSVVRYHGVVRDAEKEALLREAHLFLLPSTYPWEGQPFSIIEALAFATPVISTRYRGIPEQVVDGHNGRFVEPGDARGLAEVIRTAVSDPASYGELSRNAVAHYRQHFTQDVHLERLMAIIGAR